MRQARPGREEPPGAIDLGWEACRHLARHLQAAPRGPQALAAQRPAGMTGMWPGRGPLSIQLRVAAAQGRLIHNENGIVVIEAPGGRRAALARLSRLRCWHFVDRWWDPLVLTVPAALLLLAGIGWWLIGAQRRVDAGVALTLTLLAVVWVGVAMLAMVIREIPSRGSLGDMESASLRHHLYDMWGVVLLDVTAAKQRGDFAPPDAVDALNLAAAERIIQLWNVLPRHSNDPEPTAYYLRGVAVTSDEAAQRLAILPQRRTLPDWARDDDILIFGEYRDGVLPGRYLAFTPVPLIATVALAIALLAQVCAIAEQRSSSPGGLRDYPSALKWLVGQFFWQGVGGPPNTLFALWLGWSMRLLSIVVLGAVINWVRLIWRSKIRAEAAVNDKVWGPLASQLPTVGILTALPKETAAVRSQLKNVQDLRPSVIQGSIASAEPDRAHRVIVMQQPEGGNVFSSATITTMLQEHPSINVVLVAGIAAGVPSPHDPKTDVKLGDIVVGSWGVIAYDFVDDLRDGSKLRGGRRQPQGPLLDAVQGLEEASHRGERAWEAYIEQGIVDVPAARRPRDGRGRPGGSRVIEGLIGSGDRSLRDANKRDALNDARNIRAFEMEAYGLATIAELNGRSWLVVRGISDYGDENADSQWRDHAAMAAAAYVRALLETMPPWEPRR